jgi:peroxiredoxin
MKRFTIFILSVLFFINCSAQSDTLLPPFRKFPSYPPVKLLLPDSLTYYTKKDLPGKLPVIIMYFNPSCDHCQHETEEILKNMDRLKKVQIVMATMAPFKEMIDFRKKYKLDTYNNIIVSRDEHYFLSTFYNVHNLPFLAFYNRKKELIDTFEGSMPIDKLIQTISK